VFVALEMMDGGNFSPSIVTPRRTVHLEEDTVVAHPLIFYPRPAKVDPETRSKSTFVSSMFTMSLALYSPALSPAFTKATYPALTTSSYLVFFATWMLRRQTTPHLRKCR
jgi:hypothetical protein